MCPFCRYDPAQKGVLSVPSLLKELGITIATHTAAPRSRSPTKGTDLVFLKLNAILIMICVLSVTDFLSSTGTGTGTELWASSQTKAPTLPADVLESLQSTLDATHQQMLHKLQEVDKYKSGKASLQLKHV